MSQIKDEKGYFLPGDNNEAERLDLQHWLIKDGFWGGRSQLFAPIDLGKPAGQAKVEILDSACGTGIWSTELSALHPDTTNFTLIDYNIEPCQFRFPKLPSNAKLLQFDLLNDFAKHPEWKDHFDLLHQRLLMFALTPDQWHIVLKGLFESTKPGGYLQLEEFDVGDIKLGPHFKKVQHFARELCAMRGMEPATLCKDLPDMLKKVGYEVVSVEEANLPFGKKGLKNEPFPDAVSKWGMNTTEAVAGKAHEMGMINDKDWEELKKGVYEEFGDGNQGYVFKTVVFVARKPL